MKQKDCPKLQKSEAVEQLRDAYQNLFMIDCKNLIINNSKDIKKEFVKNLQKEESTKNKPDFSNLSGWVSTDVTEEEFYNKATEYTKLKKDFNNK